MGYGFKRQAFGDVLMNLVPERIDAFNRQKLAEQEEAQRARQIDLQEKGFGLQERQFQAEEADKDRAWTDLTAFQKAQIENDQAQLANQRAYQGGVLGVQRDQFNRQEKRDLAVAEQAIWSDFMKNKALANQSYIQEQKAARTTMDKAGMKQALDARNAALRAAYDEAKARFRAMGPAMPEGRLQVIEAELDNLMGSEGAAGAAGGIDPRWQALAQGVGNLIKGQ